MIPRSFVLLVLLVVSGLSLVVLAPGLRPTALAGAAAPAVLLAVGQGLVMAAGGIDLSVGAMAGFAGLVFGWGLRAGVPLWGDAVLVAVLAGAIGVWHGAGVAKLRVPAFLLTLATVALLQGLGMALGGQAPAPVLPDSLAFGLAVVIAAAAGLVLHRGRIGRALFALGADAGSAQLAGIAVGRLRMAVYAACALLAALAGLLGAGAGSGIASIAAALAGGFSLAGGRGSLPGTVVAALLLSTLGDGALLGGHGLDEQSGGGHSFWPMIVSGVIILVCAAIERNRG